MTCLLAASNIGPLETLLPLLVVAAILYGVYWLVTRRGCPTCGKRLKRGLTACPHCGADFTPTT